MADVREDGKGGCIGVSDERVEALANHTLLWWFLLRLLLGGRKGGRVTLTTSALLSTNMVVPVSVSVSVSVYLFFLLCLLFTLLGFLLLITLLLSPANRQTATRVGICRPKKRTCNIQLSAMGHDHRSMPAPR